MAKIRHHVDVGQPEWAFASCLPAGSSKTKRRTCTRFIFFYGERDAHERIAADAILRDHLITRVTQNLHGGTVAATREALFDVGGFDEDFVGWGGEDLEFWERAGAHGRAYGYGYLPFIHLWHAAQEGKAQGDSPAVRRYSEIRGIRPAERTRWLRVRRAAAGDRTSR